MACGPGHTGSGGSVHLKVAWACYGVAIDGDSVLTFGFVDAYVAGKEHFLLG